MQDIHAYIKAEQNRYQIMPVPIVEGYSWSMFEHVRLTTLYLNSQYKTGPEDNKPFRNIILPKVNLEHRAVQFDLSDIQFYINSDEDYKSFLVRKWHDRWAYQNDIEDFLDQLTETYTDYGGVLIKNTKDAMEVVLFQQLAFCDQADILSGPICEQHQYSPDKLMDMASKGWGNRKNGATGTLEEVIALSKEEKMNTQSQGGGGFITTIPKAQTPGRYIEVFELHGMLPESLLDEEYGDPNKFVRQMHIVTSYQDKESDTKKGIILFSGKESNDLYKVYKRDPIYGRALGRGAVEELFEPQVWVNYAEIAKTDMLDQVSKVLNWTNDTSFKSRNDTSSMESGDTIVVGEGKTFAALNREAVNAEAFERSAQQWDDNAQQIAATTDLMAGDKEGTANMPAKLGLPLLEEGHSLHQYRKGKIANFISGVYRDWILPKCLKAIENGDEFMSDLSLDEMNEVVDQVVACQFNETMIKKVLSGEIVYPEDAQALEQTYRQQFFKNNRKFIKIFKDELKDLPIEVKANIGKTSPTAVMAQKLGAVWSDLVQTLTANPNFFQEHPEMAKFFNEMIEAYGLSSINFGIAKPVAQPPQQLTQPQPNAQSQVQSQPQAARQNVQ